MALTETQAERYARHLVLKEIGGRGQQKLLAKKVLVIGAGGLGSPVILYLAAAGVGTIGVVDEDVVALSNLQRQVLHDQNGVDQPKVKSAQLRVAGLNADVNFIAHQQRLEPDNAERLIEPYDLVCDCSDNFATRFLVNDVCHLLGKTLVSAAVIRFDGQLSVYKSYGQSGLPCYRCWNPEPPAQAVLNCATGGVLGAVVGVMGSLQATEAIKELLNIGVTHAGALTLYDGLSGQFRRIKLKRDPACLLCGDQPHYHNLDHLTSTRLVCATA